MIGVDRAEPGGDRRLDGARYHAVDVLDDGALGGPVRRRAAALGGGQHRGGLRAAFPADRPDPAVLTGQLELNLLRPRSSPARAGGLRRAAEGRLVLTASRAAR